MKKPSCEYCGRCLSVCPSYRHFLVETMGPRARIDLARAVEHGELEPGPRYAASMAACLQCLACTEICGKGVDGAGIVLEARLAQATKAEGQAKTRVQRLEAWVITKLLPRRALLTRIVRWFSLVQCFVPAEKRGTVRHVPDVLSSVGRRSLPLLSPQTLFDQVAEVVNPPAHIPPRNESVAVFSGCFGGVVNTKAALALVRRLTDMGYSVHVPRTQSCCGAPALLGGFGEAFDAAKAHNAEVFDALDMPILTLCATCHRTLHREYAGQAWTARVKDAAYFLKENEGGDIPEEAPVWLRHADGTPVSAQRPLKVAVHDPCHVRLEAQMGKALRQALAARPWVELCTLADAGSCCGGGGISSLKNAQLADSLGEARAKAVLDSGAHMVVAQCPGCVLQLNNHLSRLSAHVRAGHALELLGGAKIRTGGNTAVCYRKVRFK